MEIGENGRMALDTLRTHKTRSLLTVLGVVIGVTALTGVASVLVGMLILMGCLGIMMGVFLDDLGRYLGAYLGR